MYSDSYHNGLTTVNTAGCAIGPNYFVRDVNTAAEQMFCDNDQLNTLAPTKQNLLCNGASARSVIFSHSDLSEQNHLNSKLTKQFSSPKFNYYMPDSNHYSLVLDLTNVSQQRWELSRKALFR